MKPITPLDVLRAVFFPEEGEPSVPVEKPQPAPGPDTPAVIHYVAGDVAELARPEVGRVVRLLLGTVVALLVGVIAQIVLRDQGNPLIGWGLALASIAVWGSLLAFELGLPQGGLLKRGPVTEGSGAARPLSLPEDNLELFARAALGLAGLGFAVVTFFATANNTFTPMGVTAWLISVICALVALAGQPLPDLFIGWWDAIRSLPKRVRRLEINPWMVGGVLLIVAVGAFLRFWQLDSVPAEMTSDHVEKLLDSYRLSQGARDVFMRGNGGREALHFYVLAQLIPLTGVSFTTLKLASVLEGILLIPMMVLLGRELVDRETGLLAAAVVAVSWWHILLSRLALRIVLTPLVFTLVLIALIRGMRTGERRPWLWAGVWLGVGVYSYQAMRMAPLVAIAAFLFAAAGPLLRGADERALNRLMRQGANLIAAGVVALLIFVPMLRVWRDYPNDLWNRVVNRTTSNEAAIEGSSLGVFADNYRDALLMFNVEGDVSWFNALPGEPALSVVMGALLFLGVVSWAVRLRVRRDPVDAFVLVAILIMLLPSALAIAFPIENPSLTRASGTLPLIMVIAAWPLVLVRQAWASVLGRVSGTVLAGVLSLVVLGGATALNISTYFIRYDLVYRASSPNPGEIADSVRDVAGDSVSSAQVWVVSWPFWQDHRAIGLELGDPAFGQVAADHDALRATLASQPLEGRPLVFVLNNQDERAVQILRGRFPDGELMRIESRTPQKGFSLFVISD